MTITTVYSDRRGKVTRTDYPAEWLEWFGVSHRYSAAHRCVGNHRGDDFEYGVSITPPGVNPHAFAGYDTEEEAIAALDTSPRWPDHQRDHARALRG